MSDIEDMKDMDAIREEATTLLKEYVSEFPVLTDGISKAHKICLAVLDRRLEYYIQKLAEKKSWSRERTKEYVVNQAIRLDMVMHDKLDFDQFLERSAIIMMAIAHAGDDEMRATRRQGGTKKNWWDKK